MVSSFFAVTLAHSLVFAQSDQDADESPLASDEVVVEEVIVLGIGLLQVGAIFQLFDAVAIVADGALRGAGDTRWPFLARFVLSWGVFLPLAWMFGFYWDWGLAWAWVGGLIYIVILSGSLIWRFRSGAWREIEI